MNSRALPLLALIAAALIFFGYVNPTWRGPVKAAKAAIASNDAALAAATAYVAEQNQLAAARSAIPAADLARLLAFLPDSVDNVRIILDLNALASRSGLTLSNINVAESSGQGGESGSSSTGAPTGGSTAGSGQAASRSAANPVNSIDLTLSASGTYAALQTFLAGLERSGRLLDLRDLSVKGSNTGAYGYKMTVRLYWLR